MFRALIIERAPRPVRMIQISLPRLTCYGPGRGHSLKPAEVLRSEAILGLLPARILRRLGLLVGAIQTKRARLASSDSLIRKWTRSEHCMTRSPVGGGQVSNRQDFAGTVGRGAETRRDPIGRNVPNC